VLTPTEGGFSYRFPSGVSTTTWYVVTHKAVGMTEPVISFINRCKNTEEQGSVCVVKEDGALVISPGGDMVQSPGNFQSQRSRHGYCVPKGRACQLSSISAIQLARFVSLLAWRGLPA
jgi:hypothetical protein